MDFAFISRHQPTAGQHQMAEDLGHTLTHIGDRDAFKVSVGEILDDGPWEAVVVVHPAAALRLAPHFVVGVFENANRAPVGEPPRFDAIGFHIYDLRD